MIPTRRVNGVLIALRDASLVMRLASGRELVIPEAECYEEEGARTLWKPITVCVGFDWYYRHVEPEAELNPQRWILHHPQINEGAATLRGTVVRLVDVETCRQQGLSDEALLIRFPELWPGGLRVIQAYVTAHPDEFTPTLRGSASR